MPVKLLEVPSTCKGRPEIQSWRRYWKHSKEKVGIGCQVSLFAFFYFFFSPGKARTPSDVLFFKYTWGVLRMKQ